MGGGASEHSERGLADGERWLFTVAFDALVRTLCATVGCTGIVRACSEDGAVRCKKGGAFLEVSSAPAGVDELADIQVHPTKTVLVLTPIVAADAFEDAHIGLREALLAS